MCEEDTNELLSDIRAITQYIIDASVNGYKIDTVDAVYVAELFDRLDEALMDGCGVPDEWNA